MVSAGSLVFKEHLERLSELVLVLLVGGSLFLDSWSWPAVALALFLFVVARPLSVFLALAGPRTPLAAARHDRLVRRARHRLAVLPDVRHPARPARTAGAAD